MRWTRTALEFALGCLACSAAARPGAPPRPPVQTSSTPTEVPTPDPHPEVLVLGTYHMANPGRDVHNVQADDVLSPQRQRELEQLADVLARFRPTKVAVEAEVGSRSVAQRYADFLAGRYTLTRNEVDQVGFRVAKRLGLATVFPVDEGGDFPYYRVRNYAVANGRAAEFAAVDSAAGARARAFGDYLRAHTVVEALGVLNADSTVARDVAGYFAYVPFGDPDEYAGPDLVAAWYQRNARIYRNVRALATAPGDRVLVVYGAGHLGWLRQDAANDPAVRLRTLAEFAGSP